MTISKSSCFGGGQGQVCGFRGTESVSDLSVDLLLWYDSKQVDE